MNGPAEDAESTPGVQNPVVVFDAYSPGNEIRDPIGVEEEVDEALIASASFFVVHLMYFSVNAH
jgi:hypothetical protein